MSGFAMTSFKFPQESPSHQSALLSLAQRQGLGSIDTGAIKRAALQATSPVSDGNRDGDVDDDGDGDIEGNDVDDEHELPIPLFLFTFKHPISPNTVPMGLFKTLANVNGSSNSHSNNASIAGEGSSPILSGKTFLPLQEPPPPPRFLPRDEHAYSLFSDTWVHPQDISRRLELHHTASGRAAAQLTHAELLPHAVTKANFEEDIILERISSAEAERNQPRTKVNEIQAPAAACDGRRHFACAQYGGAVAGELDRELNADKRLLSPGLTVLKRRPVSLRGSDSAHWANGDRPARITVEPLGGPPARQRTTQATRRARLASPDERAGADRALARGTSALRCSRANARPCRAAEQETRITSSDRAASTARASLVQAQQRAAELERQTNEYEAELGDAEPGHEPVEDRAAQLDAKDAKEHLANVRRFAPCSTPPITDGSRLAAQSKKTAMATASVSSLPPPDSRTSMGYPSCAAPPTAPATAASGNSRRAPPQTSVYDSILVPLNRKAIAAAVPRCSSLYYSTPIHLPARVSTGVPTTRVIDSFA
ncbi:hypothetical protein EDB86DRAFT_2834603 [Lactarius hatsudake]|nr:hypothetical protein EDB86DRAFT_2834603 [Lactarius hatsudake]